MGNSSSLQEEAITPSGPQRLTKPRTNTNSTFAGVARHDSDSTKSTPSKPSSRGTTGHSDDRLNDSVESPLSFTTEAPFNVITPSTTDDTNLYESPTASALSVAKRAMSVRSSGSVANRHSVAMDGSESDIAAAIALLQQLRKNASPEDLVALHKALLPARSVEFENTATLPEAQDPEANISPLIRRSSLLPAGVATRNPLESVRRRPTRQASQLARRRSSSQVPRRLESGTWEQFVQGGFDALEPGSRKACSRPGAATPSDFDIPQTGDYQLGSLRVTNGAVSPEPGTVPNTLERDASVRTSSGSAVGDGFVTADEGESGNELAPRAPGTARVSPKARTVRFNSQPLPKTRSAAPLKLRIDRGDLTGDVAHSSPRALPSLPLRQRASDMANSYMTECELPRSPYSEGAPLETLASRLSTVEDNSPVNNEVNGPGDATNRLVGAAGPSRSRQVSGASDSSASIPDLDSTYLQAPRRPSVQAKTDSGYSSETSWQAQAKAHIKAANIEDVSKHAIASAELIDQGHAKISTARSRKTSLEIDFAETSVPDGHDGPTTAASCLHDAEAAKPLKQHRKLQKVRPQSYQHPTVQSLRDIAGDTLPGVPDSVQVNFSRRLDQRPGMSHLEQTYSSVDETVHRDLPANSEVITGLERLNRDDEDWRGRGREQEQRASTSKTEKKKSFLGRLRSRSRSKSQHRSSASLLHGDDEPMPVIADFGTVAQSLGSSPYDIATSQRKARHSLDGSRNGIHPHEITSERSKPFVSMDDETAAQYARSKSRDIAEQQANDRRARSSSRPRSHIAEQAVSSDRHRSTATPIVARPRHARSVSAHPSTVSVVPTVPEHQEMPARPRAYRVGTIKFEGGEAQGRISPVMMERPRTKRRTKSVSPRVSRTVDNVEASTFEQTVVSEVPQAISSVTPDPQNDGPSQQGHPVPAARSTMHPGWPGWETQARLWRERKQSLGEAMSTPSEKRKALNVDRVSQGVENQQALGEGLVSTPSAAQQQYTPTKQAPRHSPAIVVSRYVTPTTAELESHIGLFQENDPYAVFHSANPTEHLPAKQDVDRTDSAISNATYKSTASYSSYNSASSHGSTQYRAYRPGDATIMSQLNSPQAEHRRSRSQFNPRRTKTAPDFDRFSGGLGFGWERGAGFGGSAGTRQGSDQSAKRTSVQLSESHGVDLSDVPVFMTRG